MTDTASTPEPDETPAEVPQVPEAAPAEVPQADDGGPEETPDAPAPDPVPEQPEPTVVGHGVVQDNVTEPGVEVTRLPDGTEIGRRSAEDDVETVAPAAED